MNRRITLEGGKYVVDVSDTGQRTFFRHGEHWVAGQEAFGHAKLVAALVDRVRELEDREYRLEKALIHEYNEEWNVGDGITDAAKVQFLIDRIPK